MKLLRTSVLSFLIVGSSWALDITTYPIASEILLGTVTTEVRPARFVNIKAPTTGLLHLNLEPPGTQIPQGTVWAEIDPAQTALERSAVSLARQLFEAKEKPSLLFEQARTRAELTDKLAELRRQADMLRQIIKEPELASLYLREGDQDQGSDKVRYMVTQLDQQVRLLHAVLSFIGTTGHGELEVRALELKLQQQELAVARRERESRFTMPFDGEITLVPPRPPEGETLPVESGMDLARLQDFSRITARVVFNRAEWRLIEPTRLSLRIKAGDFQRPLQAIFMRKLTEEVHGREELVYYFVFNHADSSTARALVGGRISAEVHASLPRPAHLVPKLDLVIEAPENFRSLGWSSGVARIIPESKVLLAGETHLAISPEAP